MSDQPKDTRLWCLHHIGADDVYPAPDFATAQQWANWANLCMAKHADICRFVVAVWPHASESHAAGLENAVREWTLPEVSAEDIYKYGVPALQAWLALPTGQRLEERPWVMGFNAGWEAAKSEPLPSDVVALVIAGRRISEVMQSGDVSPDDRADVDAFDKALEAFASRVCWDDEGGTLPDAHGDNCTCDLTGEGTP